MGHSESRGLLLSSGFGGSSLPVPASCKGLMQASQTGRHTAQAGGLEEGGLRCPDRLVQRTSCPGGNEERVGTLKPQSVQTAPLFTPQSPQPRYGVAPEAAPHREDTGLAFGPLGHPPGKAEAQGPGCCEAPQCPRRATTPCTPPREAPACWPGPLPGSRAPAWYSPAPGGLTLAWCSRPLSGSAPHLERPAALISSLAWCGRVAGV